MNSAKITQSFKFPDLFLCRQNCFCYFVRRLREVTSLTGTRADLIGLRKNFIRRVIKTPREDLAALILKTTCMKNKAVCF